MKIVEATAYEPPSRVGVASAHGRAHRPGLAKSLTSENCKKLARRGRRSRNY
jgi:hypothetical protein